GPAAPAGRALARRVSVRSAPPTVGGLRGLLPAAGPGPTRRVGTQRGFLRARQRERDLRLLRPRAGRAVPPFQPRAFPRHARLPRRGPRRPPRDIPSDR